ncbi:MAG: DNA translocase FtsK 4TM domain-containing protein, partial [Flavobacteriaceae bacterium]
MNSKKKANKSKFKVVFGYILLFSSLVLFTSFISYIFNWKIDQSNVDMIFDRDVEVENILGKTGAYISHLFIYKLFGISSFILPIILFVSSYYILFNKKIFDLFGKINWLLLLLIWTTILSGYLRSYFPVQSGLVGFEVNLFLESYIGKVGILLILTFSFIISIAILFNITPSGILDLITNLFKAKESDILNSEIDLEEDNNDEIKQNDNLIEDDTQIDNNIESEDISIEVEEINEEEVTSKNIDFSNVNSKKFDPTLDLRNFKNPSIDLLKDYGDGTIKIDQEELESNKNRIVDTLKNYNIGIKQIKATIGPTVTLYEIIPDAGIRISKIKNLEDDIALSLSALGIRIIAPIPGKG